MLPWTWTWQQGRIARKPAPCKVSKSRSSSAGSSFCVIVLSALLPRGSVPMGSAALRRRSFGIISSSAFHPLALSPGTVRTAKKDSIAILVLYRGTYRYAWLRTPSTTPHTPTHPHPPPGTPTHLHPQLHPHPYQRFAETFFADYCKNSVFLLLCSLRLAVSRN